jgi:anti-sigma factor RsiW
MILADRDCARHAAALERLADGTLGPIGRMLLYRHMARCPACAARLAALEAMRAGLREAVPRHRAPPALAARIGAALAREAPPVRAPAWLRLRAVLPITGAGLAGALAGVGLMVMASADPGTDPLRRALIDSHVRSLMEAHLIDVPSGDGHTVKPWLSRHGDVSPPVRDLAADGFVLDGGREDYLDGRRAAAVVYRSDRHVINLYAFADPTAPPAPPHASSLQGFNIVTWRRDGIAYAAVSDVEAATLRRFAALVAASP